MWSYIREFADDQAHVKKFVFENANDVAVEAVLYRYPTYEERTVLCISTMCGCPMGCRFCGTGDYFVRSLTADEIVGQVTHILNTQIGPIDAKSINKLQIMVMSMGEPALNKALWPAFKELNSMYPNAQLLISTSGPDVDYSWIMQMSMEIDKVGLQFSVHESTDEARDKLIPFKKKMTLAQISKVGLEWFYKTGRKPYFNYCAHDNNVSTNDAERLFDLFPPAIWEATVSVVCERDQSHGLRNDHQRNLAVEFGETLLNLGYNVRVFDPAGQDTIGGGCGQLFYTQQWFKANPNKARKSVGFGIPVVHIPSEVCNAA